MTKLDQRLVGQEVMASGYCGQRGGAEEAYDSVSYYRPFVYGTPPRLERWGRRFGLVMIWRFSRWFKN
ncbi:MAG: hypothetical protein KJ732_01600 [Candidatus Margulisbacteria bacterium]|nr:hypothetical protein [Candidatus Margulisiibacteriota bacterium]